MSEFAIVILLTLQTKCGIQCQSDIQTGFTSELDCKKYGEKLKDMYISPNKTSVLTFEYNCYKRN